MENEDDHHPTDGQASRLLKLVELGQTVLKSIREKSPICISFGGKSYLVTVTESTTEAASDDPS